MLIHIQQIKSWPSRVGKALWLKPQKEDSLIKKIAMYSYDILPLSAMLVTAFVGVAAFIVGGLFNLCIGYPLKLLRKDYILTPPPPLDNFQKPPADCKEGAALAQFDTEYCSFAHFPAIFRREQKPNTSCPPPNIAVAWPPKNSQGANSLFLDFMEGKTTIPETNLSVWNLFSTAGSEKGASYWNKNAHILVPLLFPNHRSSTLNPAAPVLTANALAALHSKKTTEVRAKYIFALLMCLQFWGISLDNSLEFQLSNQFDTQAIRDNPQRALLFEQIISSLVDCGFAPIALKLDAFIQTNKKKYDLSSAGSFWDKSFKREEKIRKFYSENRWETRPFSFWANYIKTYPSTGPYDKNVASGILLTDALYNALDPLSNWLLDVFSRKEDSAPCPVLNFYAPTYFRPIAEEKKDDYS